MPVHCRRTLDQYGYPSLRRTDARDKDQVLYKYMRDREKPKVTARSRPTLNRESQDLKKSSDDFPLTVLMVDTLWLWILADDTILTFAPRKEANDEGYEIPFRADPIKGVLRSLTEDKNAEVKDCFDLAALIVYHCVEALLKGNSLSNLKVFRVFEGYTSDLIEKQTDAFKKFRSELNFNVGEGLELTRDAYKSKQSRAAKGQDSDHGEDLNNLLELRDISDELKILKRLLDQQEEHVTGMEKQYDRIIKKHKQGVQGKEFLSSALVRIRAYQRQANSLSESCKEALDSYQNLLNLKEAHSSVEEARVASEQARVVNVFTIITIIFRQGTITPLKPSKITDNLRQSPLLLCRHLRHERLRLVRHRHQPTPRQGARDHADRFFCVHRRPPHPRFQPHNATRSLEHTCVASVLCRWSSLAD